jgi:mannose-6-phosphate isomerase-like protein (cupin superfamily)
VRRPVANRLAATLREASVVFVTQDYKEPCREVVSSVPGTAGSVRRFGAMKGYVGNIEKGAEKNTTFRTVLYTAKNCQLVVMSLKPGEDIGAEVHKLDQFFRAEEGEGKAVLDGVEHHIKPGFAVLVPAGTRHNIINGSSRPMKLYTLYARRCGACHQSGCRSR